MTEHSTLNVNTFAAIGLFALFAAALFLQHNLVWLYHDDFGYATLSYVTTVDGIEGQDFKQINLLAFLRNEYMSWTGRVLPFFIEANVFKIGLPFTRCIQVGVILGVTWLTARLASKREDFTLVAAAVMLYLCTAPIFIAAGGIYWFSASISYLWGLPFLLYGALRLSSDDAFSWQAVGALTVAALFQEQVALASVTLAGLFAIQQLWANRTLKKMLTLGLTTAPILLASIFVILSPGNFKRKAVSNYPKDPERSLLEINMDKVSELLLSPIGNPRWENGSEIWLIVLAISFGILIISAARRNQTYVLGLLCALAGLISLTLALEWPDYNILLCLTAGYGVCLFSDLKSRGKNFVIGYIYIAALATIALTFASPRTAGRMFIPFFFLMAAPVAYSFTLAASTRWRWLAAAGLLVLLPASAEQSVDIYDKYKENHPYMQMNNAALRDASRRAGLGQAVAPVYLTKLPDGRYAETMPYGRPKIEKWVRRFYKLPEHVLIEWQAPPKKADKDKADK